MNEQSTLHIHFPDVHLYKATNIGLKKEKGKKGRNPFVCYVCMLKME